MDHRLGWLRKPRPVSVFFLLSRPVLGPSEPVPIVPVESTSNRQTRRQKLDEKQQRKTAGQENTEPHQEEPVASVSATTADAGGKKRGAESEHVTKLRLLMQSGLSRYGFHLGENNFMVFF